MNLERVFYFLLFWVAETFSPVCYADSLVNIHKQMFVIPEFTTSSGVKIKDVRFGYETYGHLDKDSSNAILVAHHFTGTSHAAGRYEGENSTEPAGEWDDLIGPHKTIDTNKYFVISADTLCNMNTKNPHVITTGPQSINPLTHKPYGMNFPIVTIKDFVQAQHALTNGLGIKKLQLVIGASMGSMQALEWAADYPDMVERSIAVIPAGLSSSAYLIETMNIWMSQVRNDPLWNHGDYNPQVAMLPGLQEAFKSLIMQTQHFEWTEMPFQKTGLALWTAKNQNPVSSWENQFLVEKSMSQMANMMAAGTDPDSFLYTAKAVQLYEVGQSQDLDKEISKIRAKIMLLPARSDILLFPQYAQTAYEKLKNVSKNVSLHYIEGNGGHVDGIKKITQASKFITDFMAP